MLIIDRGYITLLMVSNHISITHCLWGIITSLAYITGNDQLSRQLKQEAQLSQRGCATLHVVGNLNKSPNDTQRHSKLHRW